mmetsp:Transcript_50173/g.143474  ORF Transcript_50173/g.143474 Transcript_50173/m.143474 type:complete len:218 (+) Transcript_50173:229-882(+)
MSASQPAKTSFLLMYSCRWSLVTFLCSYALFRISLSLARSLSLASLAWALFCSLVRRLSARSLSSAARPTVGAREAETCAAEALAPRAPALAGAPVRRSRWSWPFASPAALRSSRGSSPPSSTQAGAAEAPAPAAPASAGAPVRRSSWSWAFASPGAPPSSCGGRPLLSTQACSLARTHPSSSSTVFRLWPPRRANTSAGIRSCSVVPSAFRLPTPT